jgi:hypothetical protein
MGSRWLAVVLTLAALPPAPPPVRARVLFFVATDCVYSDRYFPEMLRLQQEFAPRGVTFTWVYPNHTEHLATVQAHQQEFSAPVANAVLDSDGALTRQAAVHITPEAAILIPGYGSNWITAYHGRIDDRYVRIGLERPHASHHDLEIAIEAVLAGRPAPPATGNPVGCGIMAGP